MSDDAKECAFCNHSGKLSLEHTVSDWIADLFPGKKFASWYVSESETRRFERERIDWKARVVCEPCNNTWMSDIEGEAKIVLTPLITGQIGIPIDPLAARSIVTFAFTNMVVLDQSRRNASPFFSRRVRHTFRESRTIPIDTNIWIFGIKGHRGSGRVKTYYFKGESQLANRFQMYAYTFAYGLFACQVLSIKQLGNAGFRSLAGFEGLPIRIWPDLPRDFVWPPPYALADITSFDDFAARWSRVQIIE